MVGSLLWFLSALLIVYSFYLASRMNFAAGSWVVDNWMEKLTHFKALGFFQRESIKEQMSGLRALEKSKLVLKFFLNSFTHWASLYEISMDMPLKERLFEINKWVAIIKWTKCFVLRYIMVIFLVSQLSKFIMY